MNKPLIEACVDSYQSCVNAWKGGADRLELCAHLAIGGCTPSPFVFRQVMEDCDHIKANILIRPRFGDFLYTEKEMELMCDEIRMFRLLGANGVVIGALTPDGDLDMEKMKRMMDCAGGMDVTLHRAFDMTRDPMETLEKAIELGCKTILTSGQQSDVVAGKDLLKDVYAAAAGRIDIMAGCGVKKWNIQEVHDHTGIVVFHTTGRKGALDSGMKYRKSTVAMGLPTLSEYEIWETDEQEFRECAQIVHSFGKYDPRRAEGKGRFFWKWTCLFPCIKPKDRRELYDVYRKSNESGGRKVQPPVRKSRREEKRRNPLQTGTGRKDGKRRCDRCHQMDLCQQPFKRPGQLRF